MGGQILQKVAGFLEKRGVKDVGDAVGKMIQSGEYSLSKQGEYSKLLGNLIKEHKTRVTQEAGQVIAPLVQDMEHVASTPVATAEHYSQHVTGQLSNDPKTRIAGMKTKIAMDGVYNKFQQKGFKVAPKLNNYWPENYPREMYEKGTAENKKAISLLIAKGKTPQQAEKMLSQHNPVMYKNPLTSPYHAIESNRSLDLPEMARKDAAVPLEYIVKGIKRYHEIDMFGQKGEKIKQLLDMIQQESGQQARNYAAGMYSSAMGHNPDIFAGKAEQAINSFEIASHLGLAVFSHPAQTIQSAFVGGVRPFLESLKGAMTDYEDFHEFAQTSGAILNDTMHSIRRLVKVENESLGGKVLSASGFQKVINFQEQLHANTGRHAAIDEFNKLVKNPNNKGAIARLMTLGLDPKELLERGLNDNDIQRAGLKMTRIVVGERDVMGLPSVWKDSTAGRILTMFKSFPFNQAKFIKNYILRPAFAPKDGMPRDFRPFIYAAVMYPIIGELVADLRTTVRGKSLDERPDWDKFPKDRILDNVASAGGFGLAADVLNAMSMGLPSSTMQFLAGPVVSDAAELIDFLHASKDTKEREILRRIPTIGPALSQHLVPPKRRKKGKLEQGVVTKSIDKLIGR